MNAFSLSTLLLLLALFFQQTPSITHAAQVASALGRASASGAGGSYSPQFSADGRFVVFTSHAPNLTTNINDEGFLNVYVKDVTSGEISLVSASMAKHRSGNNSSASPSISSNGQFVVFESLATDLVANDTNNFKDIFLWDAGTGITTLVSRDSSGTGSGNGDSSNPSISPDGRYILFESSAENLVPGDTNNISDIFLRDRFSGTTALVSVGARGPTGSPYASIARSDSASMSSNGKRVVFVSTATNLVPGVTNTGGEVYVRDMAAGVTFWANSDAAGLYPSLWRSFNPIISPDGRFVIFRSGYRHLIFRSLESNVTHILTANSDTNGWPSMTRDGSKVAFGLDGAIGVWTVAALTNPPLRIALTNVGLGPVISPGGNTLAVLTTAGFSRRAALALVNLNNYSNQLVYYRNANTDLPGTIPSFGPTGTTVAYETTDQTVLADENDAFDIYLAERYFSSEYWVPDLLSTSLPTRPNRTPAGYSLIGPACLSANGRYVAFSTTDTNVYGNPWITNHFNYVLWDTWLNTNVVLDLIGNKPPVEVPFPWAPLNPRSVARGPVLSLDANVLAYAGPTFRASDVGTSGHIFSLNLQARQLAWISKGTNSPMASDGLSVVSSISADNRFIAFETRFKEIPSDYPNNSSSSSDVYLYDSSLRTNKLVNVTTNNNGPLPGLSGNPVVSADGRWVLFHYSTNILGQFSRQQMVRDMTGGRTYVLNNSSSGLPLSGIATSHVFSLNSRLAAFGGQFDFEDGNGPLSAIMIYDLYTGTNRVICTGCQNPSLDASGAWMAYERLPGETSAGDVYVQDLQSGQEFLASPSWSVVSGGNGPSYSPLLSSDARYVVFTSKASNLVDNDYNNTSDVFARDRVLGKTVLLSLNHAGTASAKGYSGRPSLSADGRTVVFQSSATDLVEGDFNRKRDIFIARLGSGDSDKDQLDDDWELAHFDSLARDGEGDFDGDGASDQEEFRSGTNPDNNSSALRVVSVAQLGSSGATLLWNSVPGKTYRLQYKDNLDSIAWQDLAKTITATSSITTGQDSTISINRYYRVILVDSLFP